MEKVSRINFITDEQRAQYDSWVKRWVDIGLSTQPANRELAEKAYKECYKNAKINNNIPVIWVSSPIVGAYVASISNTIIRKINSSPGKKDLLVEKLSSIYKIIRVYEQYLEDAVEYHTKKEIYQETHSKISNVFDAFDSVQSDVHLKFSQTNKEIGLHIDDQSTILSKIKKIFSKIILDTQSNAYQEIISNIDGKINIEIYSKVIETIISSLLLNTNNINYDVAHKIEATITSPLNIVNINDIPQELHNKTIRETLLHIYCEIYDNINFDIYSQNTINRTTFHALYKNQIYKIYKHKQQTINDKVEVGVFNEVFLNMNHKYEEICDEIKNEIYNATKSTINWHPWFGGSLWPAWSAYESFFREVCNLELPDDLDKHAESFGKTVEHGGFWWPNENFIIACERPSKISLDDNEELHCEDGKAIEWPDGWGLYMWHGTKVPEHWITNRDNLNPAEVISCTNVEVRVAGAEIIGWPKMLSMLDVKVIDKHENPDVGELIELKIPGLETPGRFLKTVCPRNGTIVEGVPYVSDIDGLPIETALHAQAWRIGDPLSEYIHPPKRT